MSMPRRRWASPPTSASGTGWVGAIRSGRPLACRSRLRLARRGFSPCRCTAPSPAALRRLPAYLQQLEMESNGKRVGLDGQPLPYATSPVLWGEPGTNGHHAFLQMLHQGTDVLPLELLAVPQASHPLPGHHNKLLANALA